MIVVSIVSGTYNRRASIERMVGSVRTSLGPYRYAYEIVLVDGGSTDGTIDWCKAQPDINLIEHGELLGAVKAFNEGARSAKGHYVILANDDISFIDDSIARSIIYMQNDLDCGIGCFYQDRHNMDWHVETMPVVLNGQQTSLPYGQVCIIPKFLGDRVGWWGDYLHTYGGDNEISCNIYELGFKVSPVPGAKIHDHHLNDELRTINNIDGASDPRAVKGQHPDSNAWGRKWTRGHLLGPNVKLDPEISNSVPKVERIIYLPIYEIGWEHLQYKQKRGLRESLAKKHIVYEYDYTHRFNELGHDKMIQELINICSDVIPTLFITQLHNADQFTADDIVQLRQYTNALFVNWNGDFWPDNLRPPENLALNSQFDFVGLINREIIEEYRRQNIDAFYWQIGWEPDGIIGTPNVYNDIVFLGNGYSTARKQMVNKIFNMGFDFALYGHWPEGMAKDATTYDFKAGCEIYRGAKLAVGDSQWPNTGFVSNRIFQILCTGECALFHQWFRDYESLGLEDGKNCIIWKDLNEFKSKAEYYLKHEQQRINIAHRGEVLALSHHSFDARIKELFEYMRNNKNSKEIPDWK